MEEQFALPKVLFVDGTLIFTKHIVAITKTLGGGRIDGYYSITLCGPQHTEYDNPVKIYEGTRAYRMIDEFYESV